MLPRQRVLEQIAEQLHRDVLERQGRPLRQAEQRHARLALEGLEWDDACILTEHLRGIGIGNQRAQIVCGNIVDVQREDLEGQVGIRQSTPARELLRAHLRIVLGQIQPAIGRQPFEQDVGKSARSGLASGAQITHQRSSSFRMRTMVASTLGRACMRAMAASIRASTVSCVSTMTSV
ncbi:hypothetical protein GALL_382930 [mine drainage metagenome]|uniref:Uncharacterized protein n=1 Tax=mine drainage metagenome TaxID=410659 RepID=A0A1J5QVP1_9ZZZZ